MLDEATIKAAKASKSLTMGTSAYTTGAEFTISGYEYVPLDENDPKSNCYPAFQTSLGTLSVQSLLRAKAVKPYADKQTGETIFARQPSGTFHDALRSELAKHRGKTNDEVLPLLVEAFKDMTFVVRLREYITVETKYGDRAVPMAHIDIVRQ